MTFKILFRSTRAETAESNATKFAQAIEKVIDTNTQVLRQSSTAYLIHFSEKEFNIIRWLSDFELLDKADVYIQLWDPSRPDVVLTTDYQIPTFPTSNQESEYTDSTVLSKLTQALNSASKKDRKKAIKATQEHSKQKPGNLTPLVPNIITALGHPTLSIDAKAILENIADETPEPIRAHLDLLERLREDDNKLVSSNADSIIEAISDNSSRKREPEKPQSQQQAQSASSTREKRTTDLYQRSSTFREKVREAYDYKCTICKSERRTPSGNPEVEAAHIVPVKHGGPDRVSNGLALCKLHHWAFDNGWISIDRDLKISIKNKPGIAGYDDFKEYDGANPYLPDADHLYPKIKYLEKHQKTQGFCI